VKSFSIPFWHLIVLYKNQEHFDPGGGNRQAAEGVCRTLKDRRLAPMTPDVQREALALSGEVWALSPDVRLGQFVAHLGFLGEAHLGTGLGYIEDDEIIAILDRHNAELLARSDDSHAAALERTGAATSVSGSPTVAAAASAGTAAHQSPLAARLRWSWSCRDPLGAKKNPGRGGPG
jgi:hypothetical protein